MKHDPMSLLLITPDGGFQKAVETAFSSKYFKVTGRSDTISKLNGSAAPLVASHDVILFDVDEDDSSAIEAARDLCAARKTGSTIYALAGDDLPLTKARELRRLGVNDVFPRAALDNEIVPQIEALRLRREAQLPVIWSGQASLGKIIAVAQSCGGAGASTVAVNLANELQGKRGLFKKVSQAKVAIVDLDIQFGSLAALLDVEETDALWSMAMEGTVPDVVFLENAMMESTSGVSVLTAPSRFGPIGALTADQIKAVIEELRKSHDYVVVDLPPVLVDWISPVLTEANRLLLTTQITVPAVRSARKLIDFYLGENPGLEIEVVANMERKPLIPAAHHRAASDLLQRKFSYWIPRDEKSAREAVDRGAPLSEVAPRSSMTRAIRNMAGALAKEMPKRAHAN